MTRVSLKLDTAGIGKLLQENCQDLIADAGNAVADAVNSQGLVASAGWTAYDLPAEITATVATKTTDRARATVTIAHPAALAMEAKHGTLTKAAAAVGLEIHG